jgi:phosphoribosylglycinamide formyltransferase 1
MKSPVRIVVLLSGRGSNFINLADKATFYSVVGVVSNNPEASGLKAASERTIPYFVKTRTSYPSKALYQRDLIDAVAGFRPDFIALAGFMEIMRRPFLEAFPHKVVNIHPSLLPAYPGLHTHERALTDGASQHGCTVHLVDGGIDTGPIIAQASCKVLPDDTPEVLAHRVLTEEHRIYPWVVEQLALGTITLSSAGATISQSARVSGTEMGFLLP